EKEEPVITSFIGSDYTKITFKPDFKRFGMEGFDDDILGLMHKRVYDLAGILKNVNVYLNGEKIPVKNFKEYIQLYTGSETKIVHEIVNDRWEIAFTASDEQFQQVSFVNSICTSKGGTHVNHVMDQIIEPLIELVRKKEKGLSIKPFQVKNCCFIFINSLIENPAFDSQTKENLTLRVSSFGSKCQPSEKFIKEIGKTDIIERIVSMARAKQSQDLKRTDGSKTTRLSGMAKLDDANYAGTKQSPKCSLILTEGDSAKTMAISGLSVVDRGYYGVFPLRGKLLNVREATHKQIMENAEINNIKKILGLQHGKLYESVESLRYGHVIIMTDQDYDGSHIKGLIINMFDYFFPS
ncbi:DNA topoisomerase 2, partial [Dictyocoela roeselum]